MPHRSSSPGLRLIALALIACMGVPLARPALAAPPQLSPEEERNRQEALEIFNQGKMSYKAGDYGAAQQLFLRAWAKYDKEPLIALALGKAYDREGNYEKAQIYFRAFLRLASIDDRELARDREATVKRVAEIDKLLASRPGILKFRGLPTGAKLLVDGKPADPDTQGELKVDAGTHSVVVTMDQRLPFERPAVTVGPGEIKEIEVVLVAPVDPRTLPRDHTWTWVAGSAAAASLMTGAVFGVLYQQEYNDFYKRFDGNSPPRPLPATLAEYKQADGTTPCKLGADCPGAIDEANDRIAKMEDRQLWMFVSLGTGAALGFATAVLYWTAPIEQTAPQASPQATWQLQPMLGLDRGAGAVWSLRF